MDLTGKTIAFFDLETTGTYWNYDAPVQIAAEIERDKEVIDTYNTLVNTNVAIAPQASLVHGIYKKDLITAPKEKEAIQDFAAWLVGNDVDVLIGYNSRAFDIRMLSARCEHFDIKNIFADDTFEQYDGYYDRVKKAKDKNMYNLKTILGRKWNLKAVCDCLGIFSENAHDALADVEMLRLVWHKFDNIL